MGHQLPANHGAGCVALPLSGDRNLEPQSGGLGWGRGRIKPDRNGSGVAGLSQGALPPPQRLWHPPVPKVPMILHANNGKALAAGFPKNCVGPRWNHGWRR